MDLFTKSDIDITEERERHLDMTRGYYLLMKQMKDKNLIIEGCRSVVVSQNNTSTPNPNSNSCFTVTLQVGEFTSRMCTKWIPRQIVEINGNY